MAKAKRWVCTMCRAVWFYSADGRCLSCKGPAEEREVELDKNGQVVLPDPK